jgi:hypothetical protein
MSTNKLFEAAAEILAGSKKSAPAMPPQKLDGKTQDIGGDTPEKHDEGKLDATSGVPSATAPTTKPSDASPDTQNKPVGGKKTVKEEEQLEDAVIAEDIDSLFSDETISEDFKSKAKTIFEARLHDRVEQATTALEEQYAGMLEEAIEQVKADLTTKVDDYLSYVVEQWMAENQIAIESGLRSELTEDFITGLRNLFTEHYIHVPEEKADLVEELATKVEELESKLNEEIDSNVQLAKALVESRKVEITRTVCEGLTDTQFEKIKSLAESVEFSTEEEYQTKLETIRENYFPSGVVKASVSQLQEQVEDTEEKKTVIQDPMIAAVAQAISKTRI